MPVNRNAIIRYMFLDQMLSDRLKHYTRAELCEQCNNKLETHGFEKVTKRTIEKDLEDLQSAPFNMDIMEERIDGYRVVSYQDKTRSLFSRQISHEEKLLLKEILNTLGQFSGLPNFQWMDELQSKLNDSRAFGGIPYDNLPENSKIIVFSNNEFLKNREHLAWFFSAISGKKAVSLSYRRFNSPEPDHYIVHPYQLREYNGRWFLICHPENADYTGGREDYLINLPLDRIESFSLLENHPYMECHVNIDEHYEDVVGITYRYDRSPERICFAVTEKVEPYIITKPLHGSQKRLPAAEREAFMEKYPELKGRGFYEITCIPDDYELLRLLMSYGAGLVVLSPSSVRNSVAARCKEMSDCYKR